MTTVIVGFGGMGRVHYINTGLLDDIDVVAVVGNGEKDRAAAEGFSLPFFSSIKEACEAFSPDVVDITTPTFLHGTHLREALSCGVKNIIVEKPVALKSTEAEAVFALAEENGVRIVPAHVMRFTKEFNALKDILNKKVYGSVLDASFSRISAMPGWDGGWLGDKNKSLFGKPEKVSSYKRKSHGSNIDEYFHVSYAYDGFLVNAEAAWLRSSIPFSASWRVILEHAVLECDDHGLWCYPEGESPYELDTHYDHIVETGINVPPTGWYYEELSAIYSYFISGEKNPLIPYADIVEELKILENL